MVTWRYRGQSELDSFGLHSARTNDVQARHLLVGTESMGGGVMHFQQGGPGAPGGAQEFALFGDVVGVSEAHMGGQQFSTPVHQHQVSHLSHSTWHCMLPASTLNGDICILLVSSRILLVKIWPCFN